MHFKRLLGAFISVVALCFMGSCAEKKEQSVADPSSIAKLYNESWIQQDIINMWNVCSAKPFFISERVLTGAMKTFLVPVKQGEFIGIISDKKRSNNLYADYSIQGPTLGCILCILRGSKPSDYSNYLRIVNRFTKWEVRLSISKIDGEQEVVDDSNALMRTIYLVHAKSLFKPENTWFDIVVAEAIKKNMEVEEFIDMHLPEMAACCEELNKILSD